LPTGVIFILRLIIIICRSM